MTQLYLNDAAWDLGNEVGASIWQGVVFFWFTGISWGKSKSLPSYKLEAMTFCKLETWVLYKVAACKSQGIVHVQRGASLRIVGKLFVYLKPICNVFPHQTEYFSEGVWVVS